MRRSVTRSSATKNAAVAATNAFACTQRDLLLDIRALLSLSATDLDVSVKAVCPARVKKAGATTLPARKLHDIVKALPSGSDILLRDDEEGFVSVQSERTNYKVATLLKDDFPTLPENKGAHEISLPAAVMSRLIGKTSFPITVEDARYYLGGALLIVQGDTVTMVTTDGHRLCFAREKVEGAKFKEERVLIPSEGHQRVEAGDGWRLKQAVETEFSKLGMANDVEVLWWNLREQAGRPDGTILLCLDFGSDFRETVQPGQTHGVVRLPRLQQIHQNPLAKREVWKQIQLGIGESANSSLV